MYALHRLDEFVSISQFGQVLIYVYSCNKIQINTCINYTNFMFITYLCHTNRFHFNVHALIIFVHGDGKWALNLYPFYMYTASTTTKCKWICRTMLKFVYINIQSIFLRMFALEICEVQFSVNTLG